MEDLIVTLFDRYPVLATVLSVLIAAHAIAVVIVNLTPTPRDDAILGKVYKVIEWIGGLVTTRAKDVPSNYYGIAHWVKQPTDQPLNKL